MGSAALFRYQLEGSSCAVITWRATWKFTLQSRVTEAWKAVAHAHDSGRYFIVREYQDETISINSHADAINYLELSKVIRPVSLQQILAAHQMRLEGVDQGPGLARPQPIAMHKIPSFSGTYWAKTLRYYRRVKEQYCRNLQYAEYMENEGIALLRERGINIDWTELRDLRNRRSELPGGASNRRA